MKKITAQEFDSLFASPEAAQKIDDQAELRKAFKTIGLQTGGIHLLMDADSEVKSGVARGILKKMYFGTATPTWEEYFKNAPGLLGEDGRETIAAMKVIHKILVA